MTKYSPVLRRSWIILEVLRWRHFQRSVSNFHTVHRLLDTCMWFSLLIYVALVGSHKSEHYFDFFLLSCLNYFLIIFFHLFFICLFPSRILLLWFDKDWSRRPSVAPRWQPPAHGSAAQQQQPFEPSACQWEWKARWYWLLIKKNFICCLNRASVISILLYINYL